ncbi:hypothetical protein EES45_25140 [Streptomyces sp. ADI97-07]|nr:hypothetical protein EES45_25140 [Streptomyces sp. ADI97-07]
MRAATVWGSPAGRPKPLPAAAPARRAAQPAARAPQRSAGPPRIRSSTRAASNSSSAPRCSLRPRRSRSSAVRPRRAPSHRRLLPDHRPPGLNGAPRPKAPVPKEHRCGGRVRAPGPPREAAAPTVHPSYGAHHPDRSASAQHRGRPTPERRAAVPAVNQRPFPRSYRTPPRSSHASAPRVLPWCRAPPRRRSHAYRRRRSRKRPRGRRTWGGRAREPDPSRCSWAVARSMTRRRQRCAAVRATPVRKRKAAPRAPAPAARAAPGGRSAGRRPPTNAVRGVRDREPGHRPADAPPGQPPGSPPECRRGGSTERPVRAGRPDAARVRSSRTYRPRVSPTDRPCAPQHPARPGVSCVREALRPSRCRRTQGPAPTALRPRRCPGA